MIPHNSISLFGISLLPLSLAAKCSIPLKMEKVGNSVAVRSYDPTSLGRQKYISNPPSNDKNGLLSPNEMHPFVQLNGYQYTTSLSLGTPQQSFHAIVDIAWSDPFVPSIDCHGIGCQTFLRRYNASSSSGYRPIDGETMINYEPIHAPGRLSSDVLTLGVGTSVSVPDFQFVELSYYRLWNHPEVIHLPFYESVLGLAIGQEWPPHSSTPLPNRVSSPFEQMANNKILDKNVFSLSLPRNTSTPGDLTLGGINSDVYSGKLVSHPLFPTNATNWQIRIEALYILPQDGTQAFPLTPPPNSPDHRNWTAHFVTRTPYLGLPRYMVETLQYLLPLQFSKCDRAAVVSCKTRARLPHLVIGLGDRQNITLTGADYAMIRVDVDDACDGKYEDECVVIVGTFSQVGDWVTDELMILGSMVLGKVFSVFDWDERAISFGNL